MPESPDIATKAEEVRAYVVAARGGAPFLSAADGRLLVRWLETGVSVARILAAVDEVAIKRRKKRARGRLTLSSCRRIIEGKKNAPPPSNSVQPIADGQLERYAQALTDMPTSPELDSEKDRLVERIRRAMRAGDPEQVAMDAIAAVRAFHESAWSLAASRHPEIREQARAELSALSAVLSAEAFEAAIEEVARDIVRRENPLVSATAVWDRLSGK